MSKLSIAVAAGLAVGAVASARPVFGPGPGGAIPDNGSVSSTINVAPSFAVTGVRVNFNGLAHTWAGDLIFRLQHGATTFTFMDRPGVPASTFGNSDDFIASNSYSWADGGVPFPEATTGGIVASGIYAPGQAAGGIGTTFASAFAGHTSDGNWVLTISDNAGGDVGSFQGWTIELIPTPGAAALFGLAGLAGLRRRR